MAGATVSQGPSPAGATTLAHRAGRGRDERKKVPRSALGDFSPSSERPDPLALLTGQGADRIPELLPIRYGRMSASPFSFYRGAALVMASDLSMTARTSLHAQLCGDAHLSNFGAYASPERRLVFDVNDFDETNPGPFEWDVKRLATSFEVAGRQNGFSSSERERIVLTSAAAYRVTMAQLAGAGNLENWYTHVDIESIADLLKQQGTRKSDKAAKKVDKAIARARQHDSLQALDRLTHVVDGQRRIISNPPLVVTLDDFLQGSARDDAEKVIRAGLRDYRSSLQSERRHLLSQFSLVDIAHKVVGVGSVGTRSWILLLSGRDENDPLFLQFKQADRSVLEAFTEPSRYKNMGARVVAGQRLMQSTSDIFLGWIASTDLEGQAHDYYFRQLRDWKLSAEVETMDAKAMLTYAKLCGATLARAHARSGDRVAIAAYIGAGAVDSAPNRFDEAMSAFAVAYADQNDRDYSALTSAIAAGQVAATAGV